MTIATVPKRIQRQRTKGWRMPDGAVYVGRPTKWGNPWQIVPVTDHHFAFADAADVIHVDSRASVGRFDRVSRSPGTGAPYWAAQAYQSGLSDDLKAEARAELAGRNLACWCRLDQPCHADVLLKITNTVPGEGAR